MYAARGEFALALAGMDLHLFYAKTVQGKIFLLGCKGKNARIRFGRKRESECGRLNQVLPAWRRR